MNREIKLFFVKLKIILAIKRYIWWKRFGNECYELKPNRYDAVFLWYKGKDYTFRDTWFDAKIKRNFIRLYRDIFG